MVENSLLVVKKSNGVLILILGILSLILCSVFTGIPAWVMGNRSIEDIDYGRMVPNEIGLIQAGRILGMISVAISIFQLLFFMSLVGASSGRQRMKSEPRCTSMDPVTGKMIEKPCPSSLTDFIHRQEGAELTR